MLEYCEGGELFQFIIDKKYLSEDVAAFIMQQLFQALEYLHSKKISHRDIKPENFMLHLKNDLRCIKMIDFGLSKQVQGDESMHTMSGSPYYIAPEVFLQRYNFKIDIWSMGVVLYIMLSGKVPFPGRTEPEIIHNVMKGEYHFNHPAFKNVSEGCKDLIQRCLQKDHSMRYSAQGCLGHPFIKGAGAVEPGKIGQEQGDKEFVEGMQEIYDQGKIKQAAFAYLSSKVNPMNVKGIHDALLALDPDKKGELPTDQFVKCLSQAEMKLLDTEV